MPVLGICESAFRIEQFPLIRLTDGTSSNRSPAVPRQEGRARPVATIASSPSVATSPATAMAVSRAKDPANAPRRRRDSC